MMIDEAAHNCLSAARGQPDMIVDFMTGAGVEEEDDSRSLSAPPRMKMS